MFKTTAHKAVQILINIIKLFPLLTKTFIFDYLYNNFF